MYLEICLSGVYKTMNFWFSHCFPPFYSFFFIPVKFILISSSSYLYAFFFWNICIKFFYQLYALHVNSQIKQTNCKRKAFPNILWIALKKPCCQLTSNWDRWKYEIAWYGRDKIKLVAIIWKWLKRLKQQFYSDKWKRKGLSLATQVYRWYVLWVDFFPRSC